MRQYFFAIFFICSFAGAAALGQEAKMDRAKFFEDTSLMTATITADLTPILRKKEGKQFPANFSTTLQNGTEINEPVLLEIRGHVRKEICYLPPLRIIFKSNDASRLKSLGTLKLVSECKPSTLGEEYLLKEYLVYKMYNMLTDMSFRVRLMNLNFVDSTNKKKPVTEHAFLVEDIKDLARRNNCHDLKNRKVNTEATDRRQMTIVAIFEYMIGNTDWAVPVSHNTRLIASQSDSLRRPYVVPYDFDYSGLVNTDYAVPDENLNIPNVRERVYRGFPRTMDELNDVLGVFRKQKDSIYSLIRNFSLLDSRDKKEMIEYLDEFYDHINKESEVRSAFIENARTE